jgi:hypothetical protein
MKKSKNEPVVSSEKTVGTRIVEKYRPKMNALSEAERKQLLQEGLAIIYGATPHPAHAHRR